MANVASLGPDALKMALEAAGQAIFEYDTQSDQISWADPEAASRLLGESGLEAMQTGQGFSKLLDPATSITREAAIRDSLLNMASYTVEYALTDENGTRNWYEERGNWMPLPSGNRLIGFIRSITEQKNREDRLSFLAIYDELTGTLNRPRIKELLRERLEDCNKSGEPLTYILAGVDGIPVLNANFGFDVTDEVIVEMSERLKAVLGNNGVLGRVSGTKFGIILDHGNAEITRAFCQDLMAMVRASVIETSSGVVSGSLCLGITSIDPSVQSADMIIARAEAALDAAKQMGEGSISAFTENTDILATRKRNTEISDMILTALNERRIKLAYQPIVGTVTEKPTKFECLIRMLDADGGIIPAPAFIPDAERLGLVHLLDRRVLELATEALAQVPDIELNVNVSWETVKDPVWSKGYLSHLRANHRLANRITVELTETQVVDAIEASIEFVSDIKEVGCKFAIDDFGAGYTSFRNLQALDIDVLKIDGSFITGISSSHENQLFVRTLLDLARNFGMKTVAEWIDSEADAMLVKGLGVDYLQGFMVGKPETDPEWLVNAAPAEPVQEKRQSFF